MYKLLNSIISEGFIRWTYPTEVTNNIVEWHVELSEAMEINMVTRIYIGQWIESELV